MTSTVPPISNLPNELLYQIFLILQPNIVTVTDNYFRNSTADLSANDFDYYDKTNNRKFTITTKQASKQKYHSTINLSRGKPLLLQLAHVNTQFRMIALRHPIWSSPCFYRLCEIPKRTTLNIHSIMRISQFIKTIEKNKLIKFNQPDIVLDPILSNHDMICQDLCLLLDRVSNPEKVQAIVLVVGWLCLGDKTLLLKLTKFKNISTLFLKGKPDPSVLYGFSNSSLKLMAKSFGNLTKLFLDGYGGNNFTWLALVRLLKNNPKLECLSLNRVRNGINLTELMEICLNLKSLTIQFSIHIPINNNARFMEGDDMALLFHGLTNASHQLIPELKGDLKSCHLKEISFHNHMNSDRQSSEVIYRVLSSIQTTKMPFDPAFYEVGTVLSLKD